MQSDAQGSADRLLARVCKHRFIPAVQQSLVAGERFRRPRLEPPHRHAHDRMPP